MVDTQGAVVGQANGLSVMMLGDYAFGRPNRITARTYVGRGSLIAIDREAELAGPIHNKGVMILAGYLGGRYAQDLPLSLSASVTFEQSYEGIDGDSASSTELYAVLSSLSDIPIRQEIAATGSVNQKGEIQAIGGVNEKIEGFFDICARKGLTGKQGVMIPAANVKNLVLRPDVVEAIAKNRFHLYRVSHIEEGIEVLTGVSAGKPDKAFRYPKDTVFSKVRKKLKKYHELSVRYGKY